MTTQIYRVKNITSYVVALPLEDSASIYMLPGRIEDLMAWATATWILNDATLARFISDGYLAVVYSNISEEITAAEVTYDNTISEVIPDNVQDALDDIYSDLGAVAPDNAESLAGKASTQTGTTLYTGKLSDGNVNYKVGDPAGSTVAYIINDATFSALSPDRTTTFNYADRGTLRVYINGVEVDSYDLATAFNDSERAGSQSYPPDTGAGGILRIDSIAWYNEYPDWQIGNATALITPSDLRQGWNTITFVHVLTGLANQITTPFDVFYDNDAGADPSMTTPTVVENAPSTKYLSGILFYNRTSTFNLSSVASAAFNNVYHQTSPVTYSSTGGTLGSGNITETDSSVSGVSNPPSVGQTMTITNKALTVPNSNIRSLNARVTVTPRDPYGSYLAQQSASENRLVDAYTTTSTVLAEYFDDENRRMPSGAYDVVPGAITGQWTSASALSNGNPQVYNGTLIYPQGDFSSGYLPTQGGGTDYSGFSGDQVYYRAFYDTDPHTNGTLEVPGSGFTDISAVGTGNLNVEIKLPSQTGWLDLGTNYSFATFTGADGDGCRTGKSGDQYSWTSGSFSTNNSGDMIMVRVTLRVNTVVITQIIESGW